MKITVSENGHLVLEEVFDGVEFVTKDGERLSVAMRDTGFEVAYQGEWYAMKEGKLTRMRDSKLLDPSDEGGGQMGKKEVNGVTLTPTPEGHYMLRWPRRGPDQPGVVFTAEELESIRQLLGDERRAAAVDALQKLVDSIYAGNHYLNVPTCPEADDPRFQFEDKGVVCSTCGSDEHGYSYMQHELEEELEKQGTTFKEYVEEIEQQYAKFEQIVRAARIILKGGLAWEDFKRYVEIGCPSPMALDPMAYPVNWSKPPALDTTKEGAVE